MRNSNLKSVSRRNYKPVSTLFAALFLFFASQVTGFASHYSTVKNGLWSDPSVWNKQQVAPFNINLKDTIEIKHIVDAENLKINNGGTLIVINQLKAESISLNGTSSKIIVAVGGILTTQNLQGNTDNIIDYNITPLPVTLLSFAIRNGNGTSQTNTLVWKTAQEKNNAYFSIEKSADAKLFTEAGRLEGKNTTTVSTYTFEDKNPLACTYYRLKQVDFDGTETYSEIICATRNQKYEIMGRKVVFNEAVTGNLHLLNMAGQEVKNIRLNNAATYTLPEEMQGVFILKLETGKQALIQRIKL